VKAVLLSGGVDSIALAYWQRPEVTITVDYGQKAAATEVAVAAEVSKRLGARHRIVCVNCAQLGSGDMADSQPLEMAPVPEWWPFRNQLLLTLAGMRAIALGVTELIVGSVQSDDSHADGRGTFYERADALMSMQEGGIRVLAPAIGMTTVELVRMSGVPRDLLAWAHSCHTGPLACGACRGCHKHYGVMHELYDDAY
jgi:7-cyano-7-deazaguanine synthase